MADALGIVPKRIPLSAQASNFLSGALDKLAALRPGAGLGSTAIHRGNLNMQGDHPIAHGAGGPEPMDTSPTAAPIQPYSPPARRHTAGVPPGGRASPPSNRRTTYADGPVRRSPGGRATAHTPPSPARPLAQRPKTTMSYAQAVSPRRGRGCGCASLHPLFQKQSLQPSSGQITRPGGRGDPHLLMCILRIGPR